MRDDVQMHVAFHLLQFKTKWLKESESEEARNNKAKRASTSPKQTKISSPIQFKTGSPEQKRAEPLTQQPNSPPQGHLRMSSLSSLLSTSPSTSSPLNEQLLPHFAHWDILNSALIRNMIRKVAAWLESDGSGANYDEYVGRLAACASPSCEEHEGWEEENGALIAALDIAYQARCIGGGKSRSVSAEEADRAWRAAAGAE